jgi:hypothetical protein
MSKNACRFSSFPSIADQNKYPRIATDKVIFTRVITSFFKVAAPGSHQRLAIARLSNQPAEDITNRSLDREQCWRDAQHERVA